MVSIGLPYCHIHTDEHYGVEIRDAGAMGKGVFTTRPVDLDVDAEGFYIPVPICPYAGVLERADHVTQLYGGDRWSQPYVVETDLFDNDGETLVENADTHRGIGSMINHHRVKDNAMFVMSEDGNVWIMATKPITTGQQVFVDYYGSGASHAKRYLLRQKHVSFDTYYADHSIRTVIDLTNDDDDEEEHKHHYIDLT